MMTTAPLILVVLTAQTAALSLPIGAKHASIHVGGAASEVRKALVENFLQATERGDAVAAMEVCADDFVYKTHSATTESLAAAARRLKTKVPAPKTVNQELHEERPGIFVREIVVKPVPFVTVGVRQEFELRCTDDDCELSRAEYTKLSGGKD